MTMHVKVSGVWKEITDPRVMASSAWKNIDGGWVRVNGVWKQFYSRQTAPVIPSGGIVIYNTTGTPPSGWSLYADANRMLKGWDGTLGGIGVTGGNKTISFTSTTDGAHLGSTTLRMIDGGTVSSSAGQSANSTAGGHSHTCTGDASSWPKFLRAQLIQADSNQSSLPANAVVFGNSSNIGLSELNTDSGFINVYSDSGNATTGFFDEDTTEAFSTNSAGDHTHGGSGKAYVYFGYSAYRKLTSGAHTHSFNITDIDWNLQRKIVQAFTNITADFGIPTGAIIGWESNTAPDGYAICDGTNGTIDLRNYFIYIDSNGVYGSTSGDNTVSFSYTTNTAGSHRHRGSSINNYISQNRYHDNYETHNHTGSKNISQEWSYLTLAFIQAL